MKVINYQKANPNQSFHGDFFEPLIPNCLHLHPYHLLDFMASQNLLFLKRACLEFLLITANISTHKK